MFDLISDELRRFETRLAAELESDVAFIQAIADDLVSAGGKRLRPTLSFLAARMLDAEAEVGQRVALTVELLHSASLLHDDLIDGAETRRGQETAFRRYGNVVSVMSGDYILAKVLRMLAQSDNAEFTMLVSDTAAKVCEGEVLQHEMAALGNYSVATYQRIIERKTAELISTSLEGVAILAGSPVEQRKALRAFGLSYGRAFQMQDDYLDLLGETHTLGKPTGGDLREGKVTYPVLQLLDRGSESAREIVARRASEPGDTEKMARLVRDAGIDAQMRASIAEESAAAIDALAPLPPGPAKDALASLARTEFERAA